MNKIKAFFVALLAVILGAFCFASCGGDSEKDLQGTYKFMHLTIKVGGEEQILLPGSEYEGFYIPEDFLTIKLESNGRASLIMIDEEGGYPYTEELSWKKGSGNKVVLSSSSGSRKIPVKDGVLEFDMGDGMVCVLQKQSKTSNDNVDTSVVGYYEFYYLLDRNGGKYYTGSDYEGMTLSQDLITISLSDEDTYILIRKAFVNGEWKVSDELTGSYTTMDGSQSGPEYEGCTIVVLQQGSKSEYLVYKNGTLSYDVFGGTFVLQKK